MIWLFLCHLCTNPLFCHLPEGVQLLCLIDKAADACRYLQTYGEWNRAAWLAKVAVQSFCNIWAHFESFHQLLRHACLSQGAFEPS